MAELDVAYVLLRFPSLTETFIAEEMRHIQAKGARLRLYSLLRPRDQLVHPVSQELLRQAHYAPGLLSLSLWAAQVYYLLRAPAKYFQLLTSVLQRPAPHASFLAKRLAIFLKSVWLARDLQRTAVQLVHVHFAWLPAIAGMVVSRLLNIPFTITAHAYDIYSEQNDLLGLAASFAEHIVTISEANKRAILSMNPGLPPAKVTVLRCGVDLESFRPPAESPQGKTLRITSVGSLLSKKGHEYLIRACGELQARQVDFECVIVGQGELQQPLTQLISELALEDRVSLAGARSQEWVQDRLRSSDMFVLACVADANAAGDRDGIPVAIMEAMAMGVPVISTPVSGIPELVRHETTGLLVAERNEGELASAILRLANDDWLRCRLIEDARALVTQEYNIIRNTDQLSSLFERCIRAQAPEIGSAT